MYVERRTDFLFPCKIARFLIVSRMQVCVFYHVNWPIVEPQKNLWNSHHVFSVKRGYFTNLGLGASLSLFSWRNSEAGISSNFVIVAILISNYPWQSGGKSKKKKLLLVFHILNDLLLSASGPEVDFYPTMIESINITDTLEYAIVNFGL